MVLSARTKTNLARLGIIIAVIGLIDLPDQLQSWIKFFSSLVGYAVNWDAEILGNHGRWAFTISGIFLLFVSYEVPQKIFSKLFNRKALCFVVMEHTQPWIQSNMNMQDYRQIVHTPGILYTYRIAVCNFGKRILRGVEVKLVSIQPKPHDFNSIGGHLWFRHEPSTVRAKDIPPTKQVDYLDAVFVDAFVYFLNNTGSGSWLEARTTVPGQENRRDLRLQNYTAVINANDSDGACISGEFQFSIPEHGIPILRLKDQS